MKIRDGVKTRKWYEKGGGIKIRDRCQHEEVG